MHKNEQMFQRLQSSLLTLGSALVATDDDDPIKERIEDVYQNLSELITYVGNIRENR